jgi:hypothetical protein
MFDLSSNILRLAHGVDGNVVPGGWIVLADLLAPRLMLMPTDVPGMAFASMWVIAVVGVFAPDVLLSLAVLVAVAVLLEPTMLLTPAVWLVLAV